MTGRDESKEAAKENIDDTSTKVSVFVRVRPLTSKEQKEGLTNLEGLKLDSSLFSNSNDNTSYNTAVALESSTGVVIDGFTGVLGQETLNRDVFNACFSSKLDTVLRGGTASLFCYGYTGGGKTHTVLGYGQEQGLFFLSAEKLLKDLNPQQQDGPSHDKRLFLRATACEIYLDKVYDLIGPQKRPCIIRIDEDGHLVIQGEPISEQLEGISEENLAQAAKDKNMHSTLVTMAPGLSSIPIERPEDLQALSQTCVTQRACGTSTSHNTSSRSHAILRLEVVSTAVNEARDKLRRLQAELPALKNARDNGWCLQRGNYNDKIRRLENPIKAKEKEIAQVQAELETLLTNGPPGLGGSMLLVDLAGADYDHRGGKAQKESTAINQSLLALKECLRSLAVTSSGDESKQARPPFRRSKLTRILEDSLSPNHATTRRRNKETVSVILVNVSPASNLKHGTMNALRYGQLFANSSTVSANGTKKSASKLPTDSIPGSTRIAKLREQAKENMMAPNSTFENGPGVNPEACKEELRRIYETCVPEKTAQEVESILVKFQGKEQWLLEKVKAKYLIVDVTFVKNTAAASSC